MKIYYISPSQLYFAIDEDGIFQIAKHRGRTINPHAIRLERLRVSWGESYVDRGTLLLSGWDLLKFIRWWTDNTKKPTRAKFNALFEGSTGGAMTAVTRALLKIVRGNTDEAWGEQRVHIDQQLRIAGPELLAMRRMHST